MGSYHDGIVGQQAPRWDVDEWFHLPTGTDKLEVTDFTGRLVYLYCFQSWCPGCHSHGFPTLQAVQAQYAKDKRVAFVAVQTVFEGFEVNTLAAARQTAKRHRLTIPIGHDAPNRQQSMIMQRYHNGGTPWTIIIDPKGIVRFNAFHTEPGEIISFMDMVLNDAA